MKRFVTAVLVISLATWFISAVLLLFGAEAAAENTAQFTYACWLLGAVAFAVRTRPALVGRIAVVARSGPIGRLGRALQSVRVTFIRAARRHGETATLRETDM